MMDNDSPANRMLTLGPAALSDAELLALQWGMRPARVQEALAEYGTFRDLSSVDIVTLAKARGVGLARAARLGAAFEIARRARARSLGARVSLNGPAETYAAFGALMESLPHEEFRVAYLDAQNGLLRDRVVSVGTTTAALVDAKAVFGPAITENGCTSVILMHNHPSGDATPSREDIRLTRGLVEAGRIVELRLHDHLVIGRGCFVSLAEKGLL